MKTLVVAEKPSVAGDIARALGGFKREKDYFESDEFVVSSAIGHLLEITPPPGVEVTRGKWSLKNLPVLPPSFDLEPRSPAKSSEPRLKLLAKLYKRKDIGAVINACDAGREGELIFHYLMTYLNGSKKGAVRPVRRLWLSSMTPAAIRQGFEKLRKGEELENLRRAAVCRSEADWLVGINATRAMTALHSVNGGFSLTTVGRVQTPTLAIIVQREREREAFKPRDYWMVHADFAVAAGEYRGTWVHDKETIAARKDEEGFKPERVFSEADADAIVRDCAGKSGRVTETVKPTSEIAPMLFDLTSLQREANARFGMSAKGALAVAQRLYETHKLITYPRTDSRFLPQDYPAVVKKTLDTLSDDSALGKFAATVLEKNWIAPANRRIFNDAKVSDHFAIIPTGENRAKVARLPEHERKMYDLICRRFIGVFFPPAKYLVTERRTEIGAHAFLTKGKVLQDAGWRAVSISAGKDTDLTPIAEGGEDAAVTEMEKEGKTTQPPARYSEATLLSAMEGAGKWVEDEEVRDAMRERGLGTPATRAGVIEGLIREQYLIRDGRELIPTPKARTLLRLLAALKVEALTQPAMTGEWEYQLRRIEKAQGDDQTFMKGIREMTTSIVAAAKDCGDIEGVQSDDFVTLNAPCPKCGGEMQERHTHFRCASEACGFSLRKSMAGREFSAAEAEAILAGKTLENLEGFRSRKGSAFSAAVKLGKDDRGNLSTVFVFDDQDAAGDKDPAELAKKESVGDCPKCGGTVRAGGGRYLCERAVGEGAACDFSFPRKMLQREIAPEEMRKLLGEGKTGLIENLVSRKTGRPFSAFLKMDLAKKDGKLEFEFPPRENKGGKKFGGRKKPAAK